MKKRDTNDNKPVTISNKVTIHPVFDDGFVSLLFVEFVDVLGCSLYSHEMNCPFSSKVRTLSLYLYFTSLSSPSSVFPSYFNS